MRITRLLAGGLAALLFFTVTASAEYFVVPTDPEMIANAEAIAIVRVKEIKSELAGERNIVTNIEVEPEQILKGDLGDTRLRIVEPGGLVDGRIMVVSAAPQYWVDNRALVFLTHEDGQWRTWGASLGKFDFVLDDHGRELAVRWAMKEDSVSLWTPDGKQHEERLRDSRLFVDYIRTFPEASAQPRVPARPAVEDRTEIPAPNYFVESPARPLGTPHAWNIAANGAVYPPSAYTQGTFRWVDFEDGKAVEFRITGTQPGYDSVGTAQRALAAWTNDPGSNVQYVYGGTATEGFVSDDKNRIVYNQSTGVPAGAIAYAQWFGGDQHEYKGELFYSITEGDVIVKSNLNVSAKVFDEAVTHELGHTLGFRHSDAGTPASDLAVMKSVLSGNYGANLGPWDIDAVRTVYETGVVSLRSTPSHLVAQATSTTTVLITWSPAANADHYELESSQNGGSFIKIADVTGTSYTDTGLTPNKTYVYRAKAVRPDNSRSRDSNRDHATTIMFTDDPLTPGETIKAVHLTELRTAVNAVRTAAGLATVTWTDPNPLGATVKAVHITELRNALAPALTALEKTATFSESVSPGDPIRAAHFQEIRDLVK